MPALKCPTDLTIPELSDVRNAYLQRATCTADRLESLCLQILANQYDAELKRRNSHLWNHGACKSKSLKTGPKAPV
jgi:hypothetical protein